MNFLPVSAVPNVDFPIDPGLGDAAGRRSIDHGGDRRRAAGAQARRPSPASTRSPRPVRSAIDQHPAAISIGRNIDRAARDVQAAINASLADLPSDLPSLPKFRKANPAAAPVFVLALTSKTLTTSAMYDAADTVIAQRISQVPGVGEVTVSGADQPAVRIALNPVALANAGIATDDVRLAIINANPLGPVGHLQRRPPERDAVDQQADAHRGRVSRHRYQEREAAISSGCRMWRRWKTPCATAARSPGSTSSRRC